MHKVQSATAARRNKSSSLSLLASVIIEDTILSIRPEYDRSVDFFSISGVNMPAVVWTCLPFVRSGQNNLARHSERGKKTKQTEEEVGRQHQGMDRPGVCRVPEGSGEHRQMEEAGYEVIYGAPETLRVLMDR